MTPAEKGRRKPMDQYQPVPGSAESDRDREELRDRCLGRVRRGSARRLLRSLIDDQIEAHREQLNKAANAGLYDSDTIKAICVNVVDAVQAAAVEYVSAWEAFAAAAHEPRAEYRCRRSARSPMNHDKWQRDDNGHYVLGDYRLQPSTSEGHGYDLVLKKRFVSWHALLSDAKTAGLRGDQPKVSTKSTRCKKAPGTLQYR